MAANGALRICLYVSRIALRMRAVTAARILLHTNLERAKMLVFRTVRYISHQILDAKTS